MGSCTEWNNAYEYGHPYSIVFCTKVWVLVSVIKLDVRQIFTQLTVNAYAQSVCGC